MKNHDILNFCDEILNHLTVIKGYLQLQIERKDVDYLFLILKEIDQSESVIDSIINQVKADQY
ncbi:histidine kinase [Candidatus Formimonas warabiya]|uniref:Uncharacterized protein n=1 Tax=Formimonas warabiya TaxID=1761012 RepID=A0A3G1KUA8_FORW1|nr:histidine kinase [Candidatus Formimonas warabiya]ATW26032.1 hypothetical protein DCMF_15745 [Candidatus Formimonas warabiya]